jgi:hypothetical protein
MPKTLEQVNKQLSELSSERMRLEAENFRNYLRPLISQAIGKTFAYRNNSSGGEDRWDVFRKVKGVEFGSLHAWVISEECSLRTDTGVPDLTLHFDLVNANQKSFPNPEMGWIPCDPAEFEEARVLVISQLENPILACEKLRER